VISGQDAEAAGESGRPFVHAELHGEIGNVLAGRKRYVDFIPADGSFFIKPRTRSRWPI